MTDLDSLIEELEEAEVGSEELDVAITKFLCNYGPDQPLWHTMGWTRGLDAALTLVPEGWFVAHAESAPKDWRWCLVTVTKTNQKRAASRAATPALALCIAALKAQVSTTTPST